MIVHHHDPRLSWLGAISLEQTASYTRPWRIPFEQRALFHPALVSVAAQQAGIRLSFCSTTRTLRGRICAAAANQKLDLFVDGQYLETQDLAGQTTFYFQELAPGEKRIELWLPQAGDFALEQLEIDDSSAIRAVEDPGLKWVTYGSSITQCVEAASPSRTWPALVAQEMGLDLTCLGFNGQCHLDVQVARVMRDLPAHYFSICAGINIYSAPSLNERTFSSALIGFIQIIREKHPETPILLISPVHSASRESRSNPQGWTLQRFREAVEQTCNLLRSEGDNHIRYLSGLSLMDESLADLMPDGLHPDADGYEALAGNFLLRASPLLFGDPLAQRKRA